MLSGSKDIGNGGVVDMSGFQVTGQGQKREKPGYPVIGRKHLAAMFGLKAIGADSSYMCIKTIIRDHLITFSCFDLRSPE
jgi:hypothetical protein